MIPKALKHYHDKVYVVTYPSAAERHQNAIQQLGEGNFEFVFGLNKNDTSIEELTAQGIYDGSLAKKADPKDRAMTLGHICCSIGHRLAYQRMLADGCERALIFEDDVLVLPMDEEYIEAAITNIPGDAEVIQWGWSGGRFRPAFGQLQQAVFHIKHMLGLYKFDHTMIRNTYMRPFNEYFHVASVNFLTHAYTVTSSAAEKLIELNTPIHLNSDHALIHAALSELTKSYVSAMQFFGQRSLDPSDPLESQTQKYY